MQKYSIFIGIDISKKWFDAALCIQGNLKKLPHHRFSNDQEGFNQLLDWVAHLATKQDCSHSWLFCMEHTGVYALAISTFLEQRQQPYVLENPLRIKRSMGLRRGKSDIEDARVIAEYAWRFQDKLTHRRPVPCCELLQVQALLSFRARLVRYGHGLHIANQELKAFVPSDVSVAVDQGTQQVVCSMKQRIKIVETQVEQLLRTDSTLERLYELLLSIIGIGPIIAAYLLVHTNGFTAFRRARQFACHIGIAAFKQESGTSLDLPARVSHIANHTLKTLLSTAATVAVRHDPQIRAFFLRQLERGKEDGWIYNAVKNKMVHRIFAVIKRGTPYVKLHNH